MGIRVDSATVVDRDGGCVPGTLRQVRDCSSTATLFTVDIYTVFPVPLFC